MLTFERAKECFSYDPETGRLKWLVSPSQGVKAGDMAGSCANGYRYVCVDGRRYKVSRVGWLLTHGQHPRQFLDHINGVRTDDRLSNLREASAADNQQNRGIDKRNTSGFTGVSWDKQMKKWRAKLCVGRKQNFLGLFDTPEQAADAYARAKAELHTFQPVTRAA